MDIIEMLPLLKIHLLLWKDRLCINSSLDALKILGSEFTEKSKNKEKNGGRIMQFLAFFLHLELQL